MGYFKPVCHYCIKRVDCLIVEGKKKCWIACGYNRFRFILQPLCIGGGIFCAGAAILMFCTGQPYYGLLDAFSALANFVALRQARMQLKKYRELVANLSWIPKS